MLTVVSTDGQTLDARRLTLLGFSVSRPATRVQRLLFRVHVFHDLQAEAGQRVELHWRAEQAHFTHPQRGENL